MQTQRPYLFPVLIGNRNFSSCDLDSMFKSILHFTDEKQKKKTLFDLQYNLPAFWTQSATATSLQKKTRCQSYIPAKIYSHCEFPHMILPAEKPWKGLMTVQKTGNSMFVC